MPFQIPKKRKHPRNSSQIRARKSAKLETGTSSLKSNHHKLCRRPVRLEEMEWKEVALPDALDDYEGFFGLEELSDIEIVRDKNGKTTYQKTREDSDQSHSIADLGKEPTIPCEEDKIRESEVSALAEEEWAGINDYADLDGDESPEVALYKARPKKDSAKLMHHKLIDSNRRVDNKLNVFSTLVEEQPDDGEDVKAWASLKLASETLASLSRLKFVRPTPIQSLVIPDILAGHDVIGKASTGSGKTLAFGIPILEHYISSRAGVINHSSSYTKFSKPPIALILSPTRELARQLHQHLAALCGDCVSDGPYIVTLTGGLSFQKQQRLLERADIIIATPGRLWEAICEGQGIIAWLQKIKFLVIDEADRLLSEGHFQEVGEIIDALDRTLLDDFEKSVQMKETDRPCKHRQTLVFSATFHKELQYRLNAKSKHVGNTTHSKDSLEYLLRKLNFSDEKPKFVDANPTTQMARGLKEGIYECPGIEKDLYLYAVILMSPRTRSLIFANSISSVRRLTPFLCNLNLPAIPLHSQMPQRSRLRSVEKFIFSDNAILVATDVAARGLDIPGVELVVHYHVPRTADAYIHRSGRTARAEHEGNSILLCAPEEVAGMRKLVAKVHSTINEKSSALRYLSIGTNIVTRLRPRVQLAKQLAETETAKEKARHEDNVFLQAAEDLGIEYDSEEFELMDTGKRGRGKGRKHRERQARDISKAEVSHMRTKLKSLLGERLNVGVSERYIAGGFNGVDVNALVQAQEGGFLGHVEGVRGW